MNTVEKTGLGTTILLQETFEQAVKDVIEALKKEGFGVITQINVKQTLKEKLDLNFRPYEILGACNPALAHRALEIEPRVGLLLPCNVTVSEVEEGLVEVALVDPLVMMAVFNNEQLRPVAEEAGVRFERVAHSLSH